MVYTLLFSSLFADPLSLASEYRVCEPQTFTAYYCYRSIFFSPRRSRITELRDSEDMRVKPGKSYYPEKGFFDCHDLDYSDPATNDIEASKEGQSLDKESRPLDNAELSSKSKSHGL